MLARLAAVFWGFTVGAVLAPALEGGFGLDRPLATLIAAAFGSGSVLFLGPERSATRRATLACTLIAVLAGALRAPSVLPAVDCGVEEGPVRLRGDVQRILRPLGTAARRRVVLADTILESPVIGQAGAVTVFWPSDAPMPVRGESVWAFGWWSNGSPRPRLEVADARAVQRRRTAASAIFELADRLANRLAARLALRLESGAARYARSLLLGDSEFDDAERDRLAASGAAHFFAVSGFQLAILAYVLARLPAPGSPRSRLRTTLLVLILIVYTIVVGAQPPIVRALWSAVAGILASRRLRSEDPTWTFASGAALLLFIFPEWGQDAGFLLSHAALGALIFALRAFHRPPTDELAAFIERKTTTPFGRFLRRSLAASAVAATATAPVSAAYFGQVAWASPLSNLILLPLVTAFSASALLTLAIEPLAPLTDLLYRLTEVTVDGAALLGTATLRRDAALPYGVAVAALATFGMTMAGSRPGAAAGRRVAAWALSAWLALGITALLPGPDGVFPLGGASGGATLVRCGDSIVLILIDMNGRDGEAAATIRALRAAGIDAMDTVLLTSRNPAAARVAAGVIERLGARTLILPAVRETDAQLIDLETEARSAGAVTAAMSGPMQMKLGVGSLEVTPDGFRLLDASGSLIASGAFDAPKQ